jgi:hypothetical protein
MLQRVPFVLVHCIPKQMRENIAPTPRKKKSEARVQSEFSYLPGSNAMQALVAAQFEFLRFVSPGSEHAAAVSSVKRLKVNLLVHSLWFDIVCK